MRKGDGAACIGARTWLSESKMSVCRRVALVTKLHTACMVAACDVAADDDDEPLDSPLLPLLLPPPPPAPFAATTNVLTARTASLLSK